jgi:D-aminopeptidase
MLTGRHKELSMVDGIQHDDIDGVAFVGYHTAATEMWSVPLWIATVGFRGREGCGNDRY